MKERARLDRNQQRLATLYPPFATRIAAIILRLERQELRPRIQDAYRTPEDQLAAYLAGKSKLRYSFHNVTRNGCADALAVDLLDDDNPLSVNRPYALMLASAAEAEGLVTGLRWGLPTKLRSAIDDAIAQNDWSAAIKVGWDPLHVEPRGFSVAAARSGNRPF